MIVGVTAEDTTPFFYVPFIDIRGIGITNYTQAKIILNTQQSLPKVREHIESLGYSTESVFDTVSEIDNLFATFRIILGIVGLIAVIIASLGMFNTLTVSLLERTREVGFMKAMGMKSYEIKDLFLTESLIMGILGGTGGLLAGHLGGLFINLILSIFSWLQGGETIDTTYIPNSLIVAIVLLALSVGIITGFYPAYRATKISALNALRYE
jgi:ABC-type antimicrobial peptide transport system permease subunit